MTIIVVNMHIILNNAHMTIIYFHFMPISGNLSPQMFGGVVAIVSTSKQSIYKSFLREISLFHQFVQDSHYIVNQQ